MMSSLVIAVVIILTVSFFVWKNFWPQDTKYKVFTNFRGIVVRPAFGGKRKEQEERFPRRKRR